MALGKRSVFIITIVLTLILAPAISMGQSNNESSALFGIKIGMINGNTFKLSELRGGGSYNGLYKKTGLDGGVFFDFPVGQRFYAGVSIEIQGIKIMTDRDGFLLSNDAKKLLDIGANFKIKIPSAHDAFIFRPGVGLAFGVLSDAPVIENSRFLIGKVFLETVITGGEKSGVVFDIGLWSILKGGNDDYNITMDPTLMLKLGLQF
jgi:hypothetical protein